MVRASQELAVQAQPLEDTAPDHGLAPLLARCLTLRGICDPQAIDEFLHLEEFKPHDPALMPGMAQAVERIVRAVNSASRICIYGDYDADGVSAIAILLQAIRALGGICFHYIPDRFLEGVGLHCDRLALLKSQGVDLVITVDTGSRAMEEMRFAAAIGLDVIITDHHTPGEQTPCAYAVLNPKLPGSRYPFRSLCGAGVAFKLASALDHALPGRLDLERLLKIAAIATVADMVPLHGENRWIVWAGLRAMDREEKGPLRSLLRKVGVRGAVQATDISFRVAPRLNAPGRLGDPDPAIALLDNPTPEEAGRLIEIMDGMNTVRQMIERDLSERLEDQVRAILAKDLPSFVLLAGRNWHRGILGIMACKMLRRFNRPVAVLSYGQTEAHGSIRSLPGVDLMKALGQLSSLLTSFGGHTEAAGICLPITNIPQFKMRMNELLHQEIAGHHEQTRPSVDAELAWSAIDEKLFRTLQCLAPHGMGNPQPVFLSRNLILESTPQMRGAWAHFEVSDGNLSRRCSCYLPLGFAQPFERFDSVDIHYALTPYRESFQIQVLEMKPSAQE